jgi:hypothetical protein
MKQVAALAKAWTINIPGFPEHFPFLDTMNRIHRISFLGKSKPFLILTQGKRNPYDQPTVKETNHLGRTFLDGVIAQLVERLVRNEKVWGSTPHGSTKSPRFPPI